MVAEQLDKQGKGTTWCTSTDMRHEYRLVPSDKETTKQCYFHITWGKGTGTYKLLTEINGLTIMPPISKKQWITNYPTSGTHTYSGI